MDNSYYDVVIIGAGQAGLVTSYFLKKLNLTHIVLEKGSIAESWHSQRWDSFTLNTPNTQNILPDSDPVGKYPDGFCTKDELIKCYENYVHKFDLPVISDSKVTLVEKSRESSGFLIHVQKGLAEQKFRAHCVVIASGIMHLPKIPQFSKNISNTFLQIHAGNYRSPAKIPKGAVVVVGGGRSGCQIVEDLVSAGRKVYLCTSKVGRIPRRYCGKDIDNWFAESGFLDVIIDELEDKSVISENRPLISGQGRYGHTVSLQKLEKDGVTLLGRLENAEDDKFVLKDNLGENIRFADKKSSEVKEFIDDYILNHKIKTEKPKDDPADMPWPEEDIPVSPTTLNLTKSGVSTIIWCTGFKSDFSWIDLPVLSESGFPIHKRGVSSVSGIYFVGFPWLYKRKSGLICGVAEDAEYISKKIIDKINSQSH